MNVLFKMESQAYGRSWEGCPWNRLGDCCYQTLAAVAVATTAQMPASLELLFERFRWDCCICLCQDFANGSTSERY